MSKHHSLIQPKDQERAVLYAFLKKVRDTNRKFLLQSDIAELLQSGEELEDCPDDSEIVDILRHGVDAVFRDPWLLLHYRPTVGKWRYGRFHIDDLAFERIGCSEYLQFCEAAVEQSDAAPEWTVEFDAGPFLHDVPMLKDRRQIGKGVEYLNRTLANHLFSDAEKRIRTLLDFLRLHHHRGQQFMLSGHIREPEQLREALQQADEFLSGQADDTPWDAIGGQMAGFGFEPGWGDTAAYAQETISLLSEIIDAPDPHTVEKFLSRVPMIFNVVIFSPHGYFGQSNVLGLPDTGGQIVYILDQVRALEQEMVERNKRQGLDIEPQILVVTRLIPDAGDTGCDVAEEHINGTRNARIMRIPFTTESGEVVPQWISRFHVWPYLERFTLDAERCVLAEFASKPDLIIGNYSDGNMVATLMSERLGVTQCNIAHALEKTKYLYSDLYWKENEAQYHFSAQFTADLLSMSAADFIITSTYQEIAGNRSNMGQYESYMSYTMPGLYRVLKGIDVFDPKFNIVSPGADEEVYFPHTDQKRRIKSLKDDIDHLLFGEFPQAVSSLNDTDKPIIFLMSRLDKVKNVTGFVDWFGRNERLKELANVFVIAGNTKIEDSGDEEERGQIERFHKLIDEHNLEGHLRWVPKQSDKIFNSELYRVLADHKGVFVQPAQFEAFGLTVIEAMISGLPTFATIFGGPLEIIQDGESGFHIDPNHGDEAAQRLVDFFERCEKEEDYWSRISKGGIQRVLDRYTWSLYSSRLMTLSRIYGFWKYVSNLSRASTRAYDKLFYTSVYRPIVKRIEEASAGSREPSP